MNDTSRNENSEEEIHEEVQPVAEADLSSDAAIDREIEELTREAMKPEAADVPAELTPEELLAKAKAESQENYNNYLRAVADLDTYRRRVQREKDELRQLALSGFVETILPVYDNLGLGMASVEQTTDPKIVAQGLQMVLTQFKSALEEYGVTEIAPAKGADFDHNVHEAFQTQPSEEVPEGKVLVLARKGFSIKGRLIRPANVVVSGGPAKA